MYEIAQGTTPITGYRRGDLPSVTAEVERIVLGLNDRRIFEEGPATTSETDSEGYATTTFDTGGSLGRRGHIAADDQKNAAAWRIKA